MLLQKVEDRRSTLDRLGRKELAYLARKEGRDDIDPEMPAELIRRLFQAKPPSEYPRPIRGMLGSQNAYRIPPYQEWLRVAFGNTPIPQREPEKVREVDALSDLERQWKSQKQVEQLPDGVPRNYENLPMSSLRKIAKENGLVIPRTTKKPDLCAKLEAMANG